MHFLTINDYYINRDGSIRNTKTNRILKPQPNAMGYLRVQIGGKRYFVHRLVAEKFIPNPKNLPYVNHIDGNHTNNCVDNLEWCTQKYNVNHSIRIGNTPTGEQCSWSKLKENDVIFIRTHPELSKAELAERFNISKGTIDDVRKFRSWNYI